MERADGSPIRVLLVDDEPALTNLVKMALHYEGSISLNFSTAAWPLCATSTIQPS
jgi:DNA-binding response OmpR family regulator